MNAIKAASIEDITKLGIPKDVAKKVLAEIQTINQ